jgi:hypothetical protein
LIVEVPFFSTVGKAFERDLRIVGEFIRAIFEQAPAGSRFQDRLIVGSGSAIDDREKTQNRGNSAGGRREKTLSYDCRLTNLDFSRRISSWFRGRDGDDPVDHESSLNGFKTKRIPAWNVRDRSVARDRSAVASLDRARRFVAIEGASCD